MANEIGLSRIEAILENILGADNEILPPFSRNEVLLIEIADLIKNIDHDVDPEEIAQIVTDWLNTNVDPVGSAVIVDNSLTIQGAAADAKKTGDEISGLKSDLNSISEEVDSMQVYELVGTQNGFDVTEYQDKSVKATSTISVSTESTTFDLYCCGKNHLKLKSATGGANGFTWESKEDGTLILNGTADRNYTLYFDKYGNEVQIGNALAVYNTGWRASITKSAENSNVVLWFNGAEKGDSFTLNATTTNYTNQIGIRIKNGAVCNNLVVRPMIEFGDYPETIIYEAFSGFIKTYTFDEAVTTGEIDWGVLNIPSDATTLWMYDTGNITTLYAKADLQEKMDALSAEVSGFADDIEGAYSHDYAVAINGWTDSAVTYENGLINSSGTVTSNSNFRHSNYIPCNAGDKIDYNLYGYSTQVYIVTFYNSSKARISGIVGQSEYKSGTEYAPTNTAYVVFSTSNSYTGTFSKSIQQRVSGDTLKSQLKAYTDERTSVTQEGIYITRGDVTEISGSVDTQAQGIYNLAAGMRTDYIPVSEGDTIDYRLYLYIGTSVKMNAISVYNSSKERINYVSAESTGFANGTYTIPENGAYVIISWEQGMTYNGWFKIHLSEYTEELAEFVQHKESSLKGKQWCCLGDSITYGANTTATYFNYIQDRVDITPYNFGESNTAIAKSSASVTDNIASRYTDMYDDVDIVTVFGGTNDHGQNIPIGQWGDNDQLTLYGAMKILVEGLVAKYVGKKIGFILPLPKYGQTGGVYYNYSYPSESFYPYIQCIEDVCKRYSIPTLNLYLDSGLAVGNADVRTALIPDGVHPNASGHEFISWQIQKFLESL